MSEVVSSNEVSILPNAQANFFHDVVLSKFPVCTRMEEYIDDKMCLSCTIILGQTLNQEQAEELRSEIVKIIQEKRVFEGVPGLKFNPEDILFIKPSQITEPSIPLEKNMRAICAKVEEVFSRDAIRVRFEKDTFLVYGSAPRDHVAIGGEIGKHFPDTVTNTIDFRSGRDWEEYKEPYRKIIDMYPNDVKGVIAHKNTKNGALKLKIITYSPLSVMTQRSIRESVREFVMSNITPNMPGFSVNTGDILFCLTRENDDMGTVTVYEQMNTHFPDIDTPKSRDSGFHLLPELLRDVLLRKLGFK